MSYTSILAGLSEYKESWVALNMLYYLLLLAVLDAVSGLYTAKMMEHYEIFVLPRRGYARWYHRAMLEISGIIFFLISVITLISGFKSSDGFYKMILAAAVLALNLTVISNIQMFISLLSRNVMLGYLVCMLIQLVSIFCSERMPHAGKLALIGNWGMLVRSTLIDPDGVPIETSITLEVIILILLWLFGWYVIRLNRRIKL